MDKTEIRQARLEDIYEILDVEKEAWPEELRATEEQFISRIEIFPEGTRVALIKGVIVGVVVTEIVNYNPCNNHPPTWAEIADKGFIKKTHNPNGDTLYGVDLSVSRLGRNMGRPLVEEIRKWIIAHNLKQAMLGARIPYYYKFTTKMSVEEYVNARRNKRPFDPELAFYARAGFKILKIMPHYIDDPQSCDYGVLMAWENPFYKPK